MVCVVGPLGPNVTDEIFIVGGGVPFSLGCDIYLSGMR
jgi:hypothetical protein